MSGDGARPNLFRVTVNLPTALQSLNAGGIFGTKLSISARATQIPGSTIGKVPVSYQGRQVYLAGNRTFADWTVTVMNDEDFIVRNALEQWSAAINTHRTNVRLEGLAGSYDYVSDCIVEHLGKTGEDTVINTYIMESAFPIDIQPIDLDWGDNDRIEEFTVTFSFDDWVDPSESVA